VSTTDEDRCVGLTDGDACRHLAPANLDVRRGGDRRAEPSAAADRRLIRTFQPQQCCRPWYTARRLPSWSLGGFVHARSPVMRWITLAIVATGLVTAKGVIAQDATKQDLASLKGTWRIVSYQKDAYIASAEDLKLFPKVTFDGTTFRWSDGLESGTMTLDPSRKSKTVDYTITQGIRKGQVQLAIYEVDGDTLKDCIDPSGKRRPTEFKAIPGSGYALITYKREKE
jgi:uncharacterized protein (TIGR03067 family)